MNRLQRLHDAGVSIWLDTLSRELLETGDFARLVRDFAVSGATSNPTIFAKAITGSDRTAAGPRRRGRLRYTGAVLRLGPG
jgi:transaldolase